jgi:hypothetical protein
VRPRLSVGYLPRHDDQMLVLHGKTDIAERQTTTFFSAGTPLSYKRTSGLSA